MALIVPLQRKYFIDFSWLIDYCSNIFFKTLGVFSPLEN
jgi:hypothetical protein